MATVNFEMLRIIIVLDIYLYSFLSHPMMMVRLRVKGGGCLLVALCVCFVLFFLGAAKRGRVLKKQTLVFWSDASFSIYWEFGDSMGPKGT